MVKTSSSIQAPERKAPTGIIGFDEISHGGLPRGRTTLISGGSGTGKTLFALQTLVEGARRYGEPGIFVAFEELSSQVIDNATDFDWHIEELTDQSVYFFDARLPADVINTGAFDLTGLLAGLQAKANEIGAKRIAFDSIDVLLTMLDNPIAERQELYRVRDWLAANRFTGLITAHAEFDSGNTHRQSFLQYMSDCVVLLESHLNESIVLREVRIMKYRGSAYEQNAFSFVIGPSGIEVANFVLSADVEYPISTERLSTGVPRLDTMIEGGYYKGSSILITGAPGTAKTSLAGSFARASCERSERTLYVAFDEKPAEIVRNLASVGIELVPFIESGTLVMVSSRSDERSVDDHLLIIRNLLEKHESRCLIVDPISSFTKAGGHVAALSMTIRLADFCKANGITILYTSQLPVTAPESESSRAQLSTIADTWIHLNYTRQGGERNRAINIIKSRGTAHSNQIRELILSHDGLTLADVYIAEGEVLMGALRMQKELNANKEQERQRRETARRKRELELYHAELEARLRSLQRELDANRNELEDTSREAQSKEEEWLEQERALQDIRGADTADSSTSENKQ